MVFAREISARWMAKSDISAATPATIHNRRGSPRSELNARNLRREFRKPPSGTYLAYCFLAGSGEEAFGADRQSAKKSTSQPANLAHRRHTIFVPYMARGLPVSRSPTSHSLKSLHDISWLRSSVRPWRRTNRLEPTLSLSQI